MTGELTLDQVNLLFTHLPVDLSFVDEHDEVRFYSEGPQRLFPRSPAAIGRKVQNCHVAEFWIHMHGRFVHIRYLALRDEARTYRGCLEVSQDVTGIRDLEGERRLLDWGNPR